MESGDMSSWIITNFAFEFWDIRGQLGKNGQPEELCLTESFISFDKSGKFNIYRKGSLGLIGALKVPAWGLEGLAPIFPYVKVRLPPATGCEVVGLLWKGFHPLHYLNPKSNDKIQRHLTFHMDVSDSNQSTECRQQNISSDIDYPTHWSWNSDTCSGGYPTHPCWIGVGCPTPIVAVI